MTAPLLSEFLLKCTLCLWQLARLGLQLMLSWQYHEDIESISTFVSQPSKCTFAHQSVWFGNKFKMLHMSGSKFLPGVALGVRDGVCKTQEIG